MISLLLQFRVGVSFVTAVFLIIGYVHLRRLEGTRGAVHLRRVLLGAIAQQTILGVIFLSQMIGVVFTQTMSLISGVIAQLALGIPATLLALYFMGAINGVKKE